MRVTLPCEGAHMQITQVGVGIRVQEINREGARGGRQMSYRIHVIPTTKRRIMRFTDAMKTPYGLEIIESCLSCPIVKDRLFCNLPQRALEGLDAISSSSTYPKGALLFVEGQEPRGVFVLCNGRVKLSASSADGKALILRIAEAGELIGIPGTIAGQPYEVTAEALEPIQANFIPRKEFLHFLREHGEAALKVAEILCQIYQATYQEIKYLGLSGSAAGKLAQFLLDRIGSEGQKSEAVRFTLTLTHGEIAEMIGASRETVTRLFASFKKQHLIEVHGSALTIKSRTGLAKVVEA
jgi:CRP/FNR family cyclic AMP-dependent transcriptional regulator